MRVGLGAPDGSCTARVARQKRVIDSGGQRPRPGDFAEVEVTHAAPHHLNADGGLLSLLRSRGGDAWQNRQVRPDEPADRPLVRLGLPTRASA